MWFRGREAHQKLCIAAEVLITQLGLINALHYWGCSYSRVHNHQNNRILAHDSPSGRKYTWNVPSKKHNLCSSKNQPRSTLHSGTSGEEFQPIYGSRLAFLIHRDIAPTHAASRTQRCLQYNITDLKFKNEWPPLSAGLNSMAFWFLVCLGGQGLRQGSLISALKRSLEREWHEVSVENVWAAFLITACSWGPATTAAARKIDEIPKIISLIDM